MVVVNEKCLVKIPYKYLSAVSHIPFVTWAFVVGSAWIRFGLWGKTIRSYGKKPSWLTWWKTPRLFQSNVKLLLQ